MKFGKLLQRTINLLPEIEGWLIQYKPLKQQVKELKSMQDELEQQEIKMKCIPSFEEDQSLRYHQMKFKHREMEEKFIDSLNKDLEKFNDIFVDKEEVAVISMSNLEQIYSNVRTPDQAFNCKLQYDQQYADLFLLLHWVLLSFAGINKILKKHDKLTGKMLKDSYIHNVLQQPFYSTKYISEYLCTCKERINALKQLLGNDRRKDLITEQQASLCNKTMQAMEMWMDLSQNASTPSTVIPRKLLESLQLNNTPLDMLELGVASGRTADEVMETRDVKKIRIDSSSSSEVVSPMIPSKSKQTESSAEDLWEQLAREALSMPLPFNFKQ